MAAVPEAAPNTVYLDNGTIAPMPQEVTDAVVRWMNRGDPRGEYASARECRRLAQRFRQFVAAEGAFELDGPGGFTLVVTSGASESNNHIITSAARAYARYTRKMPHIITSAADHPSVLECCRQLSRDQLAHHTELPIVPVGEASYGHSGTVDPDDLKHAIRPNTCLISIIGADPVTGTLNDLKALSDIAHAAKIPFHSDLAMLFGKSAVRPNDLGLDAYSATFYKLHGPVGVGMLVVRNKVLDGYHLGPFIAGDPGRAGIENTPGIAGAFAAYKLATAGRGDKNRRLLKLRDGIKAAFAGRLVTMHVDDYCEARPRVSDKNPLTPGSSRLPGPPSTSKGKALARNLDKVADSNAPALIWLGPGDCSKQLPGMLVFSVLRPGSSVNGDRLRAELERGGAIVKMAGRAPAIEAQDIPPELWPGVVCASLCDDTTAADAAAFVAAVCKAASSSKIVK